MSESGKEEISGASKPSEAKPLQQKRGRKYWMRVDRIERTRQRLGRTKEELAASVGYTRVHVSAVLNGRLAGSWSLIEEMERELGIELNMGSASVSSESATSEADGEVAA